MNGNLGACWASHGRANSNSAWRASAGSIPSLLECVDARPGVLRRLHVDPRVAVDRGNGQDRRSHRPLRTAVRHLVDAKLLPHPWDVTCSGAPDLGERVIHGTPADANVEQHIELLGAPSLMDAYPRLAKMLETTRGNRLARNAREWKARNGRKAMRKPEKRSLAATLHATTLFDYLWRLRIRSNYGDVSAFLMSGVEDRSHGSFHAGLVSPRRPVRPSVTRFTCFRRAAGA